MKTCSKCNQEKLESEYYKGAKGAPLSYCKTCHKLQSKAWYRANPNKIKNKKLKSDYGITLDQYSDLLEKQSNSCAICHMPQSECKKAMYVDHCHATGAIRGLLCNNCNAAIGYLADDPDLCRSAAEYLESHGKD